MLMTMEQVQKLPPIITNLGLDTPTPCGIEATIRKGNEWCQLTASGHLVSFLEGDDAPVVSDGILSWYEFTDAVAMYLQISF